MQSINKHTNLGDNFSPNSYYREVHPEFSQIQLYATKYL